MRHSRDGSLGHGPGVDGFERDDAGLEVGSTEAKPAAELESERAEARAFSG